MLAVGAPPTDGVDFKLTWPRETPLSGGCAEWPRTMYRAREPGAEPGAGISSDGKAIYNFILLNRQRGTLLVRRGFQGRSGVPGGTPLVLRGAPAVDFVRRGTPPGCIHTYTPTCAETYTQTCIHTYMYICKNRAGAKGAVPWNGKRVVGGGGVSVCSS